MPLLKYNLAEIKDIVQVEPGKYVAKLKACAMGTSKASGQPMLTWTWTLLSGPNKGQTIKSWTSLQDQALSGLKQHLVAFGMKGKVNANTDALVGKTVQLIIGTRKGQKADGTEGDFSNVIALLPRAAAAEEVSDDDEDTTEEVADAADETEEAPVETKAERLRRELAEAEAEEAPPPKPETKAERLRRELAEAEAEETPEETVEEPEAPAPVAAKPKLKRVADLKKKPATTVDTDEEEPF